MEMISSELSRKPGAIAKATSCVSVSAAGFILFVWLVVIEYKFKKRSVVVVNRRLPGEHARPGTLNKLSFPDYVPSCCS